MPSQPLVGFSLFRLAEYFTNYFVAKLIQKGITDIRAAHVTVFRELGEGSPRITDMAVRAGITKQSMSALVEHLETRGYVERSPDPSDKRAQLVRLTKKGERVRLFGERVGREVERDWQRTLGKKRLEGFRDALRELDEGLPKKT
jgi:DNA-binding MarR family transcriptional regulator